MASLKLQSSIWQFSNELYNQVQSTIAREENVILSPLSIHMALALSLMGAAGKTASEIAGALHLQEIDITEIAEEYANLITCMDPKLSIANKMFVMTGCPVKLPFNYVATQKFRAEIQAMDFATDSSSAAQVINTWIENKTNRSLRNRIRPVECDPSTRLVLVNTVHFRCLWLNAFSSNDTTRESFFHSETESTQIDTMFQVNKFKLGHLDKLDADGIILPYADSSLSMVILLPRTRSGLAVMNRSLKNMLLSEIIQQIRWVKRVKLRMPKFSAEFELKLEDLLKKMGMTSMFDKNSADFDKIVANASKIFVSSFIHKAFIEVEEAGSEAGTAIAMHFQEESTAKVKFEFFNVQHPFRYIICNTKSEVVFDGCFRNGFG